MCLSQPVSYECSVNTTGGAIILRWRVFDTNDNQVGVVVFLQGQTPTMSPIGSDFTAILTDSFGPIVSNIIFTPSLSISNYTVECDALGTGATPATCNISIPGKIFKNSTLSS